MTYPAEQVMQPNVVQGRDKYELVVPMSQRVGDGGEYVDVIRPLGASPDDGNHEEAKRG